MIALIVASFSENFYIFDEEVVLDNLLLNYLLVVCKLDTILVILYKISKYFNYF